MLTQMKEDMGMLAAKLNISLEEVLLKLKENYDGYHFTYPSPDIYNPFSLLMSMAKGKIDSYWFGSGTPTYLIKMLGKFGVNPSDNLFWRINHGGNHVLLAKIGVSRLFGRVFRILERL